MLATSNIIVSPASLREVRRWEACGATQAVRSAA